jgi:hypothetical protein
MIAAVVSGFAGAWCALLGRWAYQATRHSRAVSIAIFSVLAAAVLWNIVLFISRIL